MAREKCKRVVCSRISSDSALHDVAEEALDRLPFATGDARSKAQLPLRRCSTTLTRSHLTRIELLIRAPHLELGGILLLAGKELPQRGEGAAKEKVSTSWRASARVGHKLGRCARGQHNQRVYGCVLRDAWSSNAPAVSCGK